MARFTTAWNSFRARLVVAAFLLALTKLLLGCGGQSLAAAEVAGVSPPTEQTTFARR